MSDTDHRIVIDPDCRDGKHEACIGRAWDDEADEWVDCQCPHHLQFQFAPVIPIAARPLGATITLEGEAWTLAAVAPHGVGVVEGEGQNVHEMAAYLVTWLSWAELKTAMTT